LSQAGFDGALIWPCSDGVRSVSVETGPAQFVSGSFGRLAYRRLGLAGDVPLLLCHRFRGTLDDWDPAFLNVLAAERDVVLFDGPGVGYSAGGPQSAVADMASAALDLVSQLGFEEIDLLGWSMGGFVAQQMALSEPRLVRRLIVAGSKPGLVPGAPSPAPEVGQIAGKPVNDAEDLLYLFLSRISRRTRGRHCVVAAPWHDF
jgi:pimeloyl-ACP methyl ester carboxylesterase